MVRQKRAVLTILAGVVAGATVAAILWPGLFTGSQNALVVYCAHDSVFADAILKKFEDETGIPINVKYDSETTKSLSLVNQLKAEKDDPHCDVFWNSELLGTMDLAGEGLLEPYKGSGYERIPARFKDEAGRWTGFAARMRVWIVNTENVPAAKGELRQAELEDLFQKHADRAAIAKPLYGTTLTHYSLLWQLWGQERLKKWDAEVRGRGLRVLAGNARSKDAVAEGQCDVGWTDTDDCFEAIDNEKPVKMLPLLVAAPPAKDAASLGTKSAANAHEEQSYTIVIPNAVALIRGCHHRREAERFIDFLLSEETELALAQSKSRQIPLGKVDVHRVPPAVRQLSWVVDQGYDLRKLEGARRECLAWLKTEPQ